ncbi:MAG: flavin-dependent oxidoreductase [Beijerinckiaceae bacterium]|nr:flavin-dependent oxidoreductase [Beijerinckiaceae bacterium]
MRVAIIGAGIGGLTTALMLQRLGIRPTIFEASREIRELGVGINVLPHAIRELAELGLLPRLDAIAVRTRELIYANRFGQEIWREARGLDAGFDVPQFSIHRGRLQGLLRQTVIERLGAEAIRTGHVFRAFEETEGEVIARFEAADGAAPDPVHTDILIGCDGIHSAVRRQLYPQDKGLTWNGVMMWRGALDSEPFLDSRTMIIAGGFANKLVLYPITPPDNAGRQMINWVVTHRMGDGSEPPPRREDWNRASTLDEVLPHAEKFRIKEVDLLALIRRTPAFYEYPMADRDPLPRWTFGRVTLLGDAAHPMYPVGSNGASQAIIDARALCDRLQSAEHPRAALEAFENERLPKTAEIVRTNRLGGPEGVIDEVERRSPDGFDDLDTVISYDERFQIVRGYAALAGFTAAQVNR